MVTGAAGFIGYHVAERLLRRGDVEFASRIGNMGDLRIGEVVLCESWRYQGKCHGC